MMAKLSSPHPTAFLHLRSGGSSSIRATHHHRHQAVPEPHLLFNDAFPLSLPSSHLISSSEAAALIEQQPVSTTTSSTQVFEAVAPDASLLIGMGSVVLLCIVAGFVWANEVVPVSRTKLAISKSRGEVREYLDELSDIGSSSSSNIDIDLDSTVMTTEGMGDEQNIINQSNNNDVIRPNVGDGRDFERWLFSDWLNNNKSKGGRQKEPALPILKKAKWNSGDNPVLVTAAIMMLGVVVASVTERIAS